MARLSLLVALALACASMAAAQCPVGTAYDDIVHDCVAVSCDAESACDGRGTCVPTSIQCVRAPCPQFQCQCVAPPDCPGLRCATQLCPDGLTTYACTGQCFSDPTTGECSGYTPFSACCAATSCLAVQCSADQEIYTPEDSCCPACRARPCGGLAGVSCPNATQYCRFDASCGAADQMGECQTRPRKCPKAYLPVCTCSGRTHSNECYARAAGESVRYTGACLRCAQGQVVYIPTEEEAARGDKPRCAPDCSAVRCAAPPVCDYPLQPYTPTNGCCATECRPTCLPLGGTERRCPAGFHIDTSANRCTCVPIKCSVGSRPFCPAGTFCVAPPAPAAGAATTVVARASCSPCKGRAFGSSWALDDCTSCSCTATGAQCFVMDCAAPMCGAPVKVEGQCCPVCPNGPDNL